MSRLPSLPPPQLEGDQKVFYDELSKLVSQHFGNHFTTKSPDDSFIGPFGIFMHTPILGRPFFDLTVALSKVPGLSVQLREIAILTVGAHFEAKYELYAHERVARDVGVSENVIQQIGAGKKPDEFAKEPSDNEERKEMRKANVVYDVAKALVESSGPLKQELYDRSIELLGKDGTIALIQFVGFYAYTCILLNGFEAQVPGGKSIQYLHR